MNPYDRRRLVLASIFTVAALPALWVINRDDAGSAAPARRRCRGPARSGADTAPSDVGIHTRLRRSSSTVRRPAPILPSSTSSSRRRQRPPKQQVRPASAATPTRRSDPCTTALAPWGKVLTVTNTDNGQTTTCLNSISTPLPAGVDIVLHTDVFALISDLADAPVPVRISW